MRLLNDLRIGFRLSIAFAFVLGLSVLIGAIGMVQMSRISGVTHDIADRWLPSVQMTSQVQKNLAEFRVLQYNHLFTRDPRQWEPIVAQMKSMIATIADVGKRYEALIADDAERAAWQRFKAHHAAFMKKHDELLEMSERGLKVAATELMGGEALQSFQLAEKEVGSLVAMNARRVDAARASADQLYRSAMAGLVAALAVAVAAGAIAAVGITRSMTRPIAEAVNLAQRVAVGDLTPAAPVDRKDEAGDLLRALARMNEGLAGIVSQVRRASETIADRSGEIAAGNADLSQRTERQAGSLQQTSAAMEQLTASVRANAESTQEANTLAAGAAGAAERGGAVVGEVVQTMQQIAASSKRIAEIVGVIDGIAFQTNILALNAAVEAARAGEQGRGFAVVAGEVRTLASRSAQAAREIKSLIGESVERIENGARRSSAASDSMREIVEQVKRVTALIAQVSAVTGEQSRGVGEVGGSVQEIDRFTQQNAALVGETSASAESLRQQAGQLASLVDQFKLAEGAYVR